MNDSKSIISNESYSLANILIVKDSELFSSFQSQGDTLYVALNLCKSLIAHSEIN